MRFVGIINRDGGTFRSMNLEPFLANARQAFAGHGHEFESRIVAGKDLLEALEEAAADARTDVLLAGGGDGTTSAAAAVCFRRGKPLAVLPAGTMNLFARTLRIPLNLDDALEAIAAGCRLDVDIATANGRTFVHQYSVGVHARLVRIREQLRYRNRWEKMWASLRAVAGAISRPLRFEVEVETAQGPQRRLASSVIVTNNAIAEGQILPYAQRADDGILGVYIVEPRSQLQLLGLFFRVAVGRWRMKSLSEWRGESLKLRFPRRKSTDQATVDGELVPLEREVNLTVHPRGLKVFAPQALAEAMAEGRRER